MPSCKAWSLTTKNPSPTTRRVFCCLSKDLRIHREVVSEFVLLGKLLSAKGNKYSLYLVFKTASQLAEDFAQMQI